MELLFLLFTRGGCVSCLRGCLGAMFLPQSYQYPNLSESTDHVDGQLNGDKRVTLQWRNQIWQSLEEDAGKWCWECEGHHQSGEHRNHFKGSVGNTSERFGGAHYIYMIWALHCFRAYLTILNWTKLFNWTELYDLHLSVVWTKFQNTPDAFL